MVFYPEKWLSYVDRFVEAYEYGRQLLGHAGKEVPAVSGSLDLLCPDAGTLLLCSPHPDDELLTGALALRLMKEKRCRVINLAFSLGSDPNSKSRRFAELQDACSVVDFEWRLAKQPLGFDNIRPQAQEDHAEWQAMVEMIVAHFQEIAPDILVMPHAGDGHPSHQGVNLLACEALKLYSQQREKHLVVAETGFWHPQADPKLMVSLDPVDLALLLSGLEKHAEEMARNPYALQMPARMMASSGRGRELLQGLGEGKGGALFAELYGLAVYDKGERQQWSGKSIVV